MLASMMPKPRPSTASRCHSLVPARCSKKGISTRIVPATERAEAPKITRCAKGDGARAEKRALRRSQIIGYARKKGAPTRACHQFPWLPGTRSVTAFHGEVLNAKGRNGTAPATNHKSSVTNLGHVGFGRCCDKASLSSSTEDSSRRIGFPHRNNGRQVDDVSPKKKNLRKNLNESGTKGFDCRPEESWLRSGGQARAADGQSFCGYRRAAIAKGRRQCPRPFVTSLLEC